MTKNLTDELQRTARQALTGLQPPPQGEEVGGLPIRRLLAAAFRARYLVFGTTLFGILVGTFLAITTANTYVSEGTFALTSAGAERQMVNAAGSAETSEESIATTASYVLGSDDLLRKVVDKLGAARILQPYQPGGPEDTGIKALFFGIQRDWNSTKEADRTPEEALKRLKKTISVERPRYTPVLLARCIANNPQLAQEILKTFMDEAIKWHIEKYDSQKAYEAAEAGFQKAQIDRDVATRELNEFLANKAGVPEFGGHKRVLEAQLADALHLQQKQKEELERMRSTVAELKRQIESKEIKETIPKSEKPDTTLGLRNRLQEDIGDLLRQEIAARMLGEKDASKSKALQLQIEELKKELKKLDDEYRSAEATQVVGTNPAYTAAVENRGKLETDIRIIEATMKSAATQLAEKQKRLSDFQALEADHQRLWEHKVATDKAVTNAEAIWDSARKKKALGEGNFSTMKEMQVASLPLDKEGPNRGKLLLGGFFVGLFLGLGIVIMRSLPDSVVRTREDLEQIEGLAVIGVMPRLDGGNLRRHEAMREQGW